MIENANPILLPHPGLGNLTEIENIMRAASATAAGRDALAKFIMLPESLYIPKLLPLVEMAEELEGIEDLHRLCNIMKTLILLNDTSIIEFVVSEDAIIGVVGALECTSALHFITLSLSHPLTPSSTSSFDSFIYLLLSFR